MLLLGGAAAVAIAAAAATLRGAVRWFAYTHTHTRALGDKVHKHARRSTIIAGGHRDERTMTLATWPPNGQVGSPKSWPIRSGRIELQTARAVHTGLRWR